MTRADLLALLSRAEVMLQVAPVGGDDKDHIAEKPVELIGLLLGVTQPGHLVCDPFMGSGTTGVACVKHGRRFVGIELQERYFDIACRRIEEAWKQPRLFEEPRPKPVQERLDL